MAQTDLQIHSSLTAGGELSPRALAERCCEERLTLAALTDRRAVSGVPECIWRGAQLGVRIVPGIELDCRWREQDFLTLGIGIDITCPALLEIERTRNDSVQSFAAEQAIHTIHEAGGLAVLVPPNEMDDTFPVAAFDGIAAYGSHSRADTARYQPSRYRAVSYTGTQTRFGRHRRQRISQRGQAAVSTGCSGLLWTRTAGCSGISRRNPPFE